MGVGLGQPERGQVSLWCPERGRQFRSSGDSLWDPSSRFDFHAVVFVQALAGCPTS